MLRLVVRILSGEDTLILDGPDVSAEDIIALQHQVDQRFDYLACDVLIDFDLQALVLVRKHRFIMKVNQLNLLHTRLIIRSQYFLSHSVTCSQV